MKPKNKTGKKKVTSDPDDMVKSIRDALKRPAVNESQESGADLKTGSSEAQKSKTEETQKEKASEKN